MICGDYGQYEGHYHDLLFYFQSYITVYKII